MNTDTIEELPYWRVSYKDREINGEASLRWSCQAADEDAARDAWAETQGGDEIVSVERWPFPPHKTEWLPRGEGAKYPRDGVTVVSCEDGLLAFAPMGGGFVRRAPWEQFSTDFRSVTDEDQIVSRSHELAVFSLDWGPSIVGFTQGRRWNGWGCPILEKESLASWIKATLTSDSGATATLYWEDGKLYHCDEYCDAPRWEIEPSTLMWEGRELTVYDVSIGWCWDEQDLQRIHARQGMQDTIIPEGIKLKNRR
jgi:hypothetical protein